jgi:hypothetical protein
MQFRSTDSLFPVRFTLSSQNVTPKTVARVEIPIKIASNVMGSEKLAHVSCWMFFLVPRAINQKTTLPLAMHKKFKR